MRFCELLETNTTGFELHIDLDGVLVDFVGGVQKVMADPQFDITDKKRRGDFWHHLKTIPRDQAIEIWANLEWAPGGRELWRYVSRFNPKILSSPGYTLRNIIETGKMKWIKDNLKPKPAGIIFTPDKHKHANQFGILIDDQQKNIVSWEERGGIGILYKTGDWRTAVNELQERFRFPK